MIDICRTYTYTDNDFQAMYIHYYHIKDTEDTQTIESKITIPGNPTLLGIILETVICSPFNTQIDRLTSY